MADVWRSFPAECDDCGRDVEIYTDESYEEGWGRDGDALRCPHCGATGHWAVYDDGEAFANIPA